MLIIMSVYRIDLIITKSTIDCQCLIVWLVSWLFINWILLKLNGFLPTCKLTITCRQDYKRTFSFIANKNIFNNSIYLLKLVSWAKLFKTWYRGIFLTLNLLIRIARFSQFSLKVENLVNPLSKILIITNTTAFILMWQCQRNKKKTNFPFLA